MVIIIKNYNVGLLYLKVNNLGDVVIYDTTKYIIKDILNKKNINYKIKGIDIGDNFLDTISINKKREFYNNILTFLLDFLEKTIGKFINIDKYIFIKRWHATKEYLLIKKRVIPKLKKLDVIVFCGGGLIKYHKQQFHLIINEVTKYANKHNIPIIFNAVGIEGYDEYDVRCQILKKAINRKCVRYISTRDDLKLLRKMYDKKDAVLVNDPAFFCKEAYQVNKKDSNIIGINVIRPEIFKDYLYDVNTDILIKMFSEVVIELKKKNYDVRLFTNGAIRDQKFINKIITYINDDEITNGIVVRRPVTSKQLINNIKNYKLVIGTRLHSNIIAYSLGIPIIGIVWNVKQLLFAKLNNCEEYFITKDNFNSNYIVKLVDKAFKKQNINTDNKIKSYNFLKKALENTLKI